MERKKLSLSRRVSLGAMVAALTLLFLYASEVLTGFRFLCAALSGFFVVVLVQEDLFGTAWLCFLTVTILGFLLCPDRYSKRIQKEKGSCQNCKDPGASFCGSHIHSAADGTAELLFRKFYPFGILLTGYPNPEQMSRKAFPGSGQAGGRRNKD